MKRNDCCRVRFKGFPDLANLGVELVDIILCEGIYERHLTGILAGDGFDLILTENINPEHVSGESHPGSFVIGVVYFRFGTSTTADDVSDSGRRVQREFNTSADEVAFHQRNELPLSLRIGRHQIQSIADELEDRGLSCASGSDNAVQVF